MGRHRKQLGLILRSILKSTNVYFQPPPNTEMKYPCIVYEVSTGSTTFADNAPYSFTKRYSVTVIDRKADSEIPDEVAKLPMCIFDRTFTVDNLYHTVYSIYY